MVSSMSQTIVILLLIIIIIDIVWVPTASSLFMLRFEPGQDEFVNGDMMRRCDICIPHEKMMNIFSSETQSTHFN